MWQPAGKTLAQTFRRTQSLRATIVRPLTDLIRALAVVYRGLPGYEAPQHGLGILALRRPEVCRLRAIGGEVVHENMPAGVRRVTGTPKRGTAQQLESIHGRRTLV